ncbi:MAG: flippase-like domain-containing protein, partial [Candidatus Cloacimonetes bacterium]|nr:flippase-like domain-containing protein [Candidatus Cloacimonadota bacterium]
MKKIITFAVIGLLLVIIWLKLIDVDEMFSYFKNINIYYLILTVFFVLLAISLRAIRWHFITKRLIPTFKIPDALRYYFIGAFVDFLIPIRIGELIKSYKVKKVYNEPISKTVSTIFIDRLMDAFPIIFIVILLPFIKYKLTNVINYLIT